MLMLGAKTTGTFLAWAARLFLWASDRPVVPITAALPMAAHSFRCLTAGRRAR